MLAARARSRWSCPSPCWDSTATTAANSSTTICSTPCTNAKSPWPSPARRVLKPDTRVPAATPRTLGDRPRRSSASCRSFAKGLLRTSASSRRIAKDCWSSAKSPRRAFAIGRRIGPDCASASASARRAGISLQRAAASPDRAAATPRRSPPPPRTPAPRPAPCPIMAHRTGQIRKNRASAPRKRRDYRDPRTPLPPRGVTMFLSLPGGEGRGEGGRTPIKIWPHRRGMVARPHP